MLIHKAQNVIVSDPTALKCVLMKRNQRERNSDTTIYSTDRYVGETLVACVTKKYKSVHFL